MADVKHGVGAGQVTDSHRAEVSSARQAKKLDTRAGVWPLWWWPAAVQTDD